MKILTKDITLRYDEDAKKLRFFHPNQAEFPKALVEIDLSTLEQMSFEDASKFVGERVILLNPVLRQVFAKYFKTK